MSEKQRLLQQADWAEEHARALPDGDIRGFCEALAREAGYSIASAFV